MIIWAHCYRILCWWTYNVQCSTLVMMCFSFCFKTLFTHSKGKLYSTTTPLLDTYVKVKQSLCNHNYKMSLWSCLNHEHNCCFSSFKEKLDKKKCSLLVHCQTSHVSKYFHSRFLPRLLCVHTFISTSMFFLHFISIWLLS